jgi:hypothetical protein
MNLNVDKIKEFESYFQSDEFKSKWGDIIVNAPTILKLTILNLKIIKYPTHTILTLNDTMFYPNTKVRLIDLCKLLNYGNLSVKPYAILSDTFIHFNVNMKSYINKYELGVG